MEPTPLKKEKIELVVNGLSDGVQGFAPLQYVPGEMSNLKKLFGGTELINQQFVKPNVDKEFAQEHYSIVHIASHGHFDSDAKKTFVLTFDSKLTLDDLEQLLRPSQLREKPVELLTLSACQTAAGESARGPRAQRCTQFQARLSRPPTNQVAHSGPRERSTTASQGPENSSPMSSIASGQNHSGSSAERRTNSR